MDYKVLDVKKFIGKGKIPFEVYDRNGQFTGEIVEVDVGAVVGAGEIALQYIESLSKAFSTYTRKLTWTIDYHVPTACTDGIRIFINPIFAYKIICRSNDNIVKIFDDYINDKGKTAGK